MKLYEFKVKYLSLLFEICRELEEKYSERAEKIKTTCDLLASKLHHLRLHDMSDYLHTVYFASKEFAEFKRLIPNSTEINELLKQKQ